MFISEGALGIFPATKTSPEFLGEGVFLSDTQLTPPSSSINLMQSHKKAFALRDFVNPWRKTGMPRG